MNINCNIPWNGKGDEEADINSLKNLIDFVHKNGYQAAILTLKSIKDYYFLLKKGLLVSYSQSKKDIDFPITIKTLLKYKSPDLPIPLIPQFLINEPKNPQILKSELSNIVNKKALYAVQSSKKEVLEVASRDGRVDVLSIPSIYLQKALTKGIISLAKQNKVSLSLSLSELIEAPFFDKSKIARSLHSLFTLYRVNTHTYIIGSHTNNNWLIRGPREYSSILETLFQISHFNTKTILKTNAEEIAMRFMKRDLNLFIESDIEIVDIKTEINNAEDEE